MSIFEKINEGFEKRYGKIACSDEGVKDGKKMPPKDAPHMKHDGHPPIPPKKPMEEKKRVVEYKNVGQDVAEYQKWVDYDMDRYKKISDKTMDLIKKAGLSVVKDQYGQYEVISKEKVREALRKKFLERKIRESIAKRRANSQKITESKSERKPIITADKKKKITEAVAAYRRKKMLESKRQSISAVVERKKQLKEQFLKKNK